MGYALLWVENLAVGLLLIATMVACIARLQRPWLRVVLSLLAAFPPLVAYASVVLGLGHLRFYEMVLIGCFYPLVLLTVFYAIGAVSILWGLRRRGDAPVVPMAAAWPRGRLALLLAVAVGLHMMTWWNLDLAVKQRLAGLQAESGALALSIAPARIPDRDNAALIYAQTYEALNEDYWPQARRDQWYRWTDFDSERFDPADPDLAGFLKDQEPILILLRQASEKPGCHFGREYGRLSSDLLLPELIDLRNAARLLALDARYRADQGDVQTAMADINAMFTIAEHVGGEPFLISTLVAIAIDAIATETLQEVLASKGKLEGDGRITAEQLQAIDLDGSLSFGRLFVRALRAEEAGALNAFHQFSCGDPEAWGLLGDAAPTPPMHSIYRMFMATDDVASYRKLMSRIAQNAAKPYCEAKQEWDDFETDFYSEPRGLFTSMFMPTMSLAAQAMAHGDARHRTARIALAAARYRAEQGTLPETLDELVPNYIPILPRDPFDGKPIRYRNTVDGALIYSIGPDGKDDHGTPWDKEAKAGDVAFELKR